jgi:hypothetical protein
MKMVAYQEQVPWMLVCEFEGLRVMGAHYGTVTTGYVAVAVLPFFQLAHIQK